MTVNEVDGKLRHAIVEIKEHHQINYDPDDDGYSDEDAIDDLLDECGQDGSGHCLLAGSEYCDFECPFRD